ncbi:unnamed protein product, partial [Staurois parvus]
MGPVSLPKLKKAYEKELHSFMSYICLQFRIKYKRRYLLPVLDLSSKDQGRTDNSWGPRAIGDHGAPVSLPKLKKAYEKKGTRGISWGPLLTPGPRAVPEFPNGQSAP